MESNDRSSSASPSGLLVRRLGIKFDLPRAIAALEAVLRNYKLNEEFRQLNFVHREPVCHSVYDGTGTLYDKATQSWSHREGDFRFFADEFKSSYFAEIYQQVAKFLREQSYAEPHSESQAESVRRVGRMRLMLMPPKSCYSMHEDPTVRFHFPLITNSQAFIIFRAGQIFHLPATGDLYLVDTRDAHTAMNGGDEARIHLVLSEAEPFTVGHE